MATTRSGVNRLKMMAGKALSFPVVAYHKLRGMHYDIARGNLLRKQGYGTIKQTNLEIAKKGKKK